MRDSIMIPALILGLLVGQAIYFKRAITRIENTITILDAEHDQVWNGQAALGEEVDDLIDYVGMGHVNNVERLSADVHVDYNKDLVR